MKSISPILTFAAVVIFAISGLAQTGGGFDLSHNVISGGGHRATGAGFTLEGTVGQPNAGDASAAGTTILRSGFWEFEDLAPTAANISIGGQIRTATGIGIRNVQVTLTNLATGETSSALSSTFGYYRFDDVAIGHLYLLTVRAKQFVFEPDMRILSPHDDLSNEDFMANPVYR